MSTLRVISDLHVGHEKMCIKRGYSSSEDYFEQLKEAWNKHVHKRDSIWILGDLTMEKNNYEWLDELKGQKNIILGNHDLPQHVKFMMPYVNKVGGIVKYKGVWLSHCPIHTQELRGKINIHGHLHEHVVDDERYYNVCVEHVGLCPVPLQGIKVSTS